MRGLTRGSARPNERERASESVASASGARAVGFHSKFRDVSSKFREEIGVPGVPGVPRCSARVPGVPRVPRCSARVPLFRVFRVFRGVPGQPNLF